MNYKTEREKAYYQLGHCAGYGEMGREIITCLDDEGKDLSKFKKWLHYYIKLEEKDNNDMLEKLKAKLKIKTLDGSMADENLVVKEKG